MASILLSVEGMSCGHCVKHVTEALQGVTGVQSAAVSLENNSAQLEVEEGFDAELGIAAIKEAGYSAKRA